MFSLSVLYNSIDDKLATFDLYVSRDISNQHCHAIDFYIPSLYSFHAPIEC